MSASPVMLSALRERLRVAGQTTRRSSCVSTRFDAFDALASAVGGGLMTGAIHEILHEVLPDDAASTGFFAATMVLAIASAKPGAWIVWSDPHRTLYPPALARVGIPLDRLLILRPRSPADELWSLAECMRCEGVAATVANVGRLTQVQARRLQLAAEQGGGIGVLIRPDDTRAVNYAAATRWRVRSIPSAIPQSMAQDTTQDTTQRWSVELVYGHGGRAGERFVLEVDREAGRASAHATAPSDTPVPVTRRTFTTAASSADDPLRLAADLADRSRPATTAIHSAAHASRRSSA